jgi:hypothetical protein
MIEWRLRIGTKLTGLVLKPDPDYPQLWRIHYKGQVSDMVNLSRAKEAARSWLEPPPSGTEASRWKRAESPTDGRRRV